MPPLKDKEKHTSYVIASLFANINNKLEKKRQ